jgi:hypothetical protein
MQPFRIITNYGVATSIAVEIDADWIDPQRRVQSGDVLTLMSSMGTLALTFLAWAELGAVAAVGVSALVLSADLVNAFAPYMNSLSKIYCAFSGFVLALLCSSSVEYNRFVDSGSSIFEKIIILCAWIFTLYAIWLLLRRNVWAGRILAIITGLSMLFLRLNVSWLHEEGFWSTSLFAFATLLRFISLLLIVRARHDGWFGTSQLATSPTSVSGAPTKIKPPMPALQAATGILLGLGMMSITGQTRWPNAQLIGASLLAVAAILLGVFIWRYRKR